MPTVPIDQATLDALVSKVAKLTEDKTAADDATAASGAAHAALQKAQADAATADTAEATADGLVAADLADLRAFVDGLAAAGPTG
jgi:hypothetical protein